MVSWQGSMRDGASGLTVNVSIYALRVETAEELVELLRNAFGKPPHMRAAQIELKSRGMIALFGHPRALTHLLNKLDLKKDRGEAYVVGFEDDRSLAERIASVRFW